MQETEQLFKSNLFRLQMEELLAEVTPPFGKANSALETALKELKGQLCALPATELSWERTGEGSAEAAVSQPHLSTLRLNNPAVRMPFLPPSKVQLVGSYLLRTSVRPSINIDLAVEIPAKCLHEKDYLDQRYSDKRMLYLAHIGESLRAHHSHIRFGTLSHAPLASWPVLLVPLQSGADVWQVDRIPTSPSPPLDPTCALTSRRCESCRASREKPSLGPSYAPAAPICATLLCPPRSTTTCCCLRAGTQRASSCCTRRLVATRVER